jgi:chromosome segregation ATPase
LEDADLFRQDAEARFEVESLHDKRQQLSESIESIKEAIQGCESAIASQASGRAPIDHRIAEYQRGIGDLERQKAQINAGRQTATTPSGQAQITNNVGMVNLAIAEHQEGIRQLRGQLAPLDDYVSKMRAIIQGHSDEMQTLAEQLQSADADLKWAKREAGAAADKARHAKEELRKLNEEETAKMDEVRDCVDRKRAEVKVELEPGAFLRR